MVRGWRGGDQMKMEMHEEALGVFALLNMLMISWV